MCTHLAGRASGFFPCFFFFFGGGGVPFFFSCSFCFCLFFVSLWDVGEQEGVLFDTDTESWLDTDGINLTQQTDTVLSLPVK